MGIIKRLFRRLTRAEAALRIEANGVIEGGERFTGAAFVVGGILQRVAVPLLGDRPFIALGVNNGGTIVRAEAYVRLGLRKMLSPDARGRVRQNLRYAAGCVVCAVALWREFKGGPIPAGGDGRAAEIVEDCMRNGSPVFVRASIALYEDEGVRDLIRSIVLLAGGSLCAWCEGFGRREGVDVEREGMRLVGDGGATE